MQWVRFSLLASLHYGREHFMEMSMSRFARLREIQQLDPGRNISAALFIIEKAVSLHGIAFWFYANRFVKTAQNFACFFGESAYSLKVQIGLI